MKRISLSAIFLLTCLYFYGQFNVRNSQPKEENQMSNQRSIELPFVEDWMSSSFETNNWTTECDNWVINNMEGNDRPSAEFESTPLINNYSCSLISDTIDGSMLHVGQIFLKFDLKIDVRNPTGTENLYVEVFDGDDWFSLKEFANEANMGWTSFEIEITDFAMDKAFLLRFNAHGEHSFDVKSWYIDNIEIYRECGAPYDLFGLYSINSDAVVLSWSPPEITTFEPFHVIQWDDGFNFTDIGITSGGDFSAASFYDEPNLENYISDTIKTISMFLTDVSFTEIVVKIWIGEEADSLIFQKTVDTPKEEEWNTVEIDSLITIKPETKYWFGYTIVGQLPSTSPAGADNGPAIAGYGDLIKIGSGSWGNLSDAGLNYNWNIRIKLTAPDNSVEGCSGFNVYRKAEFGPDYTYYGSTPFVENQLYFEFLDYDTDDFFFHVCYKVNAVWTGQGDTCISQYGLTEVPIFDYVCVILMDDIIENKSFKLNITPNPASKTLKITSTIAVQNIGVYDLQGKLLIEKKFDPQNEIDLDVGFLKQGLYIINAEGKTTNFTDKFIKN